MGTAVTARKSLEPWIFDSVKYYPHQIDGVRQLARFKSFLLADDMGLGKSLQAMTVFAVDVVRGWAESCIVVCPVTLKGNWADELDKFTTFPYVLLEGGPAAREKQLHEFIGMKGPRVLIVNYEQVKPHLDLLNTVRFDVKILDEAHYCKSYKTARTKACISLFARRTFLLTGTPMLNHVNELWPLLHMIDPQAFSKYWNFVSRYCNTPDAPIWMADASFKPIGKIEVGDKVMGWERVGNRRSRKIATVLNVQHRDAPVIIEVTMESGNKIKCTPDHLWLKASHGNNGGDMFAPIVSDGRGIKLLSKVIQPTPELSPVNQRQLDWLMGIYDGEGSATFIAQSKSHNPKIHARIADVLNNLFIDYRETEDGFDLRGGTQLFTNLLNWNTDFIKREYFTKRILQGNHSRPDLAAQMNRLPDRIKSVKILGPGEVVSMETTTGNYVAWGYASKNCVFGGYKDKQIVGTKNEKELRERLHGIMLRRLKSEVLDLPPVQIIERRVDLTSEQRKLYDEVIADMRITRPDEADDEEIENALTKFLRLKQICGTTFPFTGEDMSSKLDLVIEDDCEILENGHKVVEYTQFRDVLACYVKRMEKEGHPVWQIHGDIKQPNRLPIIKEWAATKEPGVLICMLQIAREGLNLTASNNGAFIDELFVPGLNQQAIDRMHRIGTDKTQPVQIRKYICRNTIENRIQQILRVKSKLFGEIVESDPDWKRKVYRAIMEDDAA